MKKLLLFFLLLFSLHGFAQSWAAPGATWYYDFNYFSSMGFERIQKTGDTVIAGKQYDKLQIYRKWYDALTQTYGSFYQPQLEFTRSDSGVVYYYRDTAEYVLYDFNAQPGDTWLLRADVSIQGSSCDTGSVVVDSVSTMIVNGDTLRKIYTSPVNWNGISFMWPVVEKIGGLANLFPYEQCVADFPQGYNLRCYYDSTGWTYHNPNWAYACDDMTGIQEANGAVEPFAILPDPQTHSLTLRGPQIGQGALIRVYDARGQLMLDEKANACGLAELNFSAPAGIYFVTVVNGNFTGSITFLFQ